MSNRTKTIIILIALIQIVLIVGLLAMPTVVKAIPGRYRVWLQENHPGLSSVTEGVIDQVAPVATALPAAIAAAGDTVDISALIAEQPVTVIAAQSNNTSPGDLAPVTAPTLAVTADAVLEPTPTLAATLEPTSTPTPAPSPTPFILPDHIVLQDMGVIRQSFNNCGPANLTQVLNWYGTDITQEQVASYLKPNPEDRNVSPWQIADYVNEQTPGYQAIARSGGDLELVKRFVASGFPVVIEKGYSLPESGWWGHYLTVYGYDDTEETLYSQDSYLGPWDGSGREDTYDEIVELWEHFNNTFYVVYQPEDEATIRAILGEDMYDDLKMWQNVAASAEERTRANPDDAFAWFNLGTALTRMGGLTGERNYYQGGAQAYDKAREIGLPPRMLWYQFQPYLAYMKTERYQDIVDLADATLDTQGGRNVEETYWYKGHALTFLGDVSGAVAAYNQALEVNENFYPAQWSLDSLQSGG